LSEQPLTCAVCGSPLEPDDRFCRFCGATVGPAPTRTDPDQATLPQTPVVSSDTPPEPPETSTEWPATDDALWRSPEQVELESPAEEVIVEADEIVVEPAPMFASDPELSTPDEPEPVYAVDPPPGPALPFSPDPFLNPPPPPPEPKSSNRIWWIVGGIVVFLILMCCCLSIGIAAIANADSAFHDELRGTAGLWLAGW